MPSQFIIAAVMPPKSSKLSVKHKLKTPLIERATTRSHNPNNIDLVNVNSLDLSVSSNGSAHNVFERSQSLGDLSAENSLDKSLDDSLVISHSQSTACLTPNGRLSE